MDEPFTIEERDPQPVAWVICPAPESVVDEIGKGIQEVFAHLCSIGVDPTGPPLARSTWLEGEALAIGFPVAAAIAGGGVVVSGELPGGRLARALHIGPHDALGATLASLRRWITEQELEEAGIPWETYLTNPREVADPAAWRTELFVPVRSRA